MIDINSFFGILFEVIVRCYNGVFYMINIVRCAIVLHQTGTRSQMDKFLNTLTDEYKELKHDTLERCENKKGDMTPVDMMVECDRRFAELVNSILKNNRTLKSQLATETQAKKDLIDSFAESRARSENEFKYLENQLAIVVANNKSLVLIIEDRDRQILGKDCLLKEMTMCIRHTEEKLIDQESEFFHIKNDIILLDTELSEFKNKCVQDCKMRNDDDDKLSYDELYNSYKLLKTKYDEHQINALSAECSALNQFTEQFNEKLEFFERIVEELKCNFTLKHEELCECVKQKNFLQREKELLMAAYSELLDSFHKLKIQCDEYVALFQLSSDKEKSLREELTALKYIQENKDSDLKRLRMRISELDNERTKKNVPCSTESNSGLVSDEDNENAIIDDKSIENGVQSNILHVPEYATANVAEQVSAEEETVVVQSTSFDHPYDNGTPKPRESVEEETVVVQSTSFIHPYNGTPMPLESVEEDRDVIPSTSFDHPYGNGTPKRRVSHRDIFFRRPVSPKRRVIPRKPFR